MPEVALMIWDYGAERPVMNEVDYCFVPRIGDYLDLPNPKGGGSVYRVFAVVVHHTGNELDADVHAEQVSPEMTPSGSHIAAMRLGRSAR